MILPTCEAKRQDTGGGLPTGEKREHRRQLEESAMQADLQTDCDEHAAE